jgi:hypothetical protein
MTGFEIADEIVGYGFVAFVVIGFCVTFYLAFLDQTNRRRKHEKPKPPDTLEDILAQILVLHDRLEAIADGRTVDRDRVGAAVGELVE